MTFKEFLFWFEGYSEAITSAPNKDQWEKIKEKLKKVDTHEDEKKNYAGAKEVISYPVYVKEYVYPYCTPYIEPSRPWWGTITCQSSDMKNPLLNISNSSINHIANKNSNLTC